MSTRTRMVANVCVFIAKPTTSQLVVECPLCSPSRCPAEMYPYILDKANRLEFVCDSKGRVSLVPRPPHPAFVACSTKNGGRPGRIYHGHSARAILSHPTVNLLLPFH